MKKETPVGSLLRKELAKGQPLEFSYEVRIAELERAVQWLIREVKHLREGTAP